MPSPFPGMDPYLEERSLWPDIHSSLISYIREALQPQVRPKYIARIGERIEVASLQRGYIPDVMIVQPPREQATALTSTGVLVADEPLTFAFLEEARRVPYIEIVYRETGDVVTVIEVLSPANKNGEGREQYLQKQADLLTTHANLVEIDLLGEGRATTLARTAALVDPPDWRYVVSVSRARNRSRLEVYAIRLQDRLPRCRIPLRPADPDVVLDLPTVFARCYAVGGYDLLVDYHAEPPVTLSQAELAWLHTLAKPGHSPDVSVYQSFELCKGSTSMATVRYLVHDVDVAVDFYTHWLGFSLAERWGPAFAIVEKGDLKLWLSGPQTSAAKPMPDGRQPEPGGWNRLVIEVNDLATLVEGLKQNGLKFRNEIIEGPGGKQILAEDPAGNPLELFEGR